MSTLTCSFAYSEDSHPKRFIPAASAFTWLSQNDVTFLTKTYFKIRKKPVQDEAHYGKFANKFVQKCYKFFGAEKRVVYFVRR